MPTAVQTSAFFSSVETENQLLEKFIVLLQEEQRLLLGVIKDELPSLNKRKTNLSDALTQHAEKRMTLMVEADIPSTKEELNAWINQQDETSVAEWHRLLELAKEAKKSNELNGRLLAERLSNNQQAIQTLMAAANRPATYGPDGQTTASGPRRTLGSA